MPSVRSPLALSALVRQPLAVVTSAAPPLSASPPGPAPLTSTSTSTPPSPPPPRSLLLTSTPPCSASSSGPPSTFALLPSFWVTAPANPALGSSPGALTASPPPPLPPTSPLTSSPLTPSLVPLLLTSLTGLSTGQCSRPRPSLLFPTLLWEPRQPPERPGTPVPSSNGPLPTTILVAPAPTPSNTSLAFSSSALLRTHLLPPLSRV